jgi:hypothetical protein
VTTEIDTTVTGWCRTLFDKMAVGGVWTIPRSGMVFRREADRMIWVAVVPPEADFTVGLSEIRKLEFKETREEFAKAGIAVLKADNVTQCTDHNDAERRFKKTMTTAQGKKCFVCHQIKPIFEFPSDSALTCSFCTPVSDTLSMAMQRPHDMRIHPGNPTMRELARLHPASAAASMSEAMRRDGLLLPADKPAKAEPAPDDRPLIDKLHEATFNEKAPGLSYIKDKYGLRMVLRKAHCFTLDKITSGLIGDFSMAIATDLESARRMAIPPFPVTWIEIDNRARLQRMVELGVGLTDTAAGKTAAGEAVERVGWLIHPGHANGFYATYCTQVTEGVVLSPLSWWWHTGHPGDTELIPERDGYIQWLTFGVKQTNVGPSNAYPDATPLHYTLKETVRDKEHINEMMRELSGELRHIWGFLIALGAGQLGMEAKTSAQPKPMTTPPVMKNGKPLLPLEHKLLHLHLAKKMTPAKVLTRMITHHKHRWHEVRAHWRTLKNADGTVKARVPVKAHERGDERLGRIEKQYSVER